VSAQTLDVAAADGHRFQLTLFAAQDTNAPLLLFLPAMGTRARYYTGFGTTLGAQGVSFATMDWRGSESSSLRASRRVNFGYRELLESDIPAAIAALRAALPEAPRWIGGHSLGGQLSALYAGRAAPEIQGLVLIAAGSVHYRGWSGAGALRLLALTQFAIVVSSAVGHFPGRQIGFAAREARGVIRDWARVARNGRYRVAGSSFDYESAMTALQKPVFALGFKADTLAPRHSTERLLGKLPKCAQTYSNWGAAESGGVALDHFSWAKRPELVAPAVADWVRQKNGARP
jgi:predicted alpha/beta hydrolase